jgi:tetratricopeptide (TPR) repeat protein
VLRKRLFWLLGNVLRDQDRPGEAAEALASAVERQRAVVQFSPESRWQRIHLYQLELDRAQILRDLAKYEEAKATLEVTVAELQELQGELSKSDGKTSHDVKNLLVRSHVTLSCLLNRMGNHEEADAVLRQAENQGR